VLGRRDPIIGTYVNASVILIEDYDIGDEGAGFPSVLFHRLITVRALKRTVGAYCSIMASRSRAFHAAIQCSA
jgi:hypothetical protein